MIHFVVVSGAPGRVGRAAPLLPAALQRTRYFEGTSVEAATPAGTWAFAAIEANDPVLAPRFTASDDSLVVINGPVLATGRAAQPGGPHLAGEVLDRMVSGGSTAVGDALGGSFNFVGVSPTSGLLAFGDLAGLHPLYLATQGDMVVVSNRSTTVAEIAGPRSWDLRSMGWLIGHANIFGERLPASGVRHLPPGAAASSDWASGDLRVARSPEWIWPKPDEAGGRDDLTPLEWDEVAEHMVGEVATLRTWDRRLRMGLTGGKDSRLCLALTKAAGLSDCIQTFTMGAEGNPEVEVAALLAEATGFDHTRIGSAVLNDTAAGQPSVDAERLWRRLRQHAYRYEGIVSPWDGMNDPDAGTIVTVQGFGGELYRLGHGRRFRNKHLPTVEAMTEMFYDYHQSHDPLGLLPPEEVDFQRGWLQAWVHDTAQNVRLDTLPDKFFVDQRVAHWNGPLGQAKAGRISVNPLVSRFAARKALELSPAARSSDRLHFEVMRRTAPEILGVPFVQDTWPEPVARSSPIEVATEPYRSSTPVTGRPAATTGWQVAFLRAEKIEIDALFAEAESRTDMGTICDMDKLRSLDLAEAQLRMPEARTVLSCISIAINLLGRSEQVVDQVGEPARG